MADAPRRSFLDVSLVATLIAFAGTSLLCDRTAALDIIGPDSSDPFARAVYWYGVRYDPLVVANPLFLQVMSGISAFVFGPLYLWLARGLWRRDPKVRMPALLWVVAMMYSMIVHVAVELWGELPPPNLAVFVGVYAGYVVVPLLIAWRVRRPDFDTP
jgi:hypothetical protein